MPKIAEIKEIDGHLWVKLDRPKTDEGAIHIWTEFEAKRAIDFAIGAFTEATYNYMRQYRT